MIAFTISGEAAVVGYLKQIPPKLLGALTKTMTVQMIELSRYVKEQKVSGQVLKNRSGTLRRKINHAVKATADSIMGSVGLKLAYAAAHEYGFDGTVQVKAHERQMNIAFGRPVALPRKIQVAAHGRNMKLPERSYLRISLKENHAKIVAALDRAAGEAVQ